MRPVPARVAALGLPYDEEQMLAMWLGGECSADIARELSIKEHIVARRLIDLRLSLKNGINTDGHKIQRLDAHRDSGALPGRLTDDEAIDLFEGPIPQGEYEWGGEEGAEGES